VTASDAPAFFFDGPESAPHWIVLTHGAGAPVDDLFFETLVDQLVQRELRVIRFEFPYMSKRRLDGKRRGPDRTPTLLDTWRGAIEALGGGSRLAIGGKSMGGRMASLIADEVAARALVCLGYPFHPPGRPTQLRTEHLQTLRTPTLILQGTRDPFGTPAEVAAYGLSETIHVHWLKDGDHSLKPRKRSGRSAADHLADAAERIAVFLDQLD